MSVTAPEMGPRPIENSGAGPLRLMRGPTIPTLGVNGLCILSGPQELYLNA
jgi:hypothetical protein